MLVSVIIPVHNIENYVERCVESVLNQTYKELEIILVDDGSTDNSGGICDDMASKDSRCIVIHQKNQKLSGARNTGLHHANGTYISFIDGDDYLHPQMIGTLVKLLEEHKDCQISMVYGQSVSEKSEYGSTAISRLDSVCNFYTRNEYLKILLSDSSIESFQFHVVWNKLYKASTIKGKAFDKVFNEDLVFNYKIASEINKIVSVPERLYYWVQRETSISRSNSFYTNPKIIDSYIICYNTQDNVDREIKDLCLSKIMKRVLSSREYLTNNQVDDKIYLKEIVHTFRGKYMMSKNPFREKVIVLSMLGFPGLYSLFQWYINHKK